MNEIHEFDPQPWPSNRLHNTTFMEKSAIKLIYFDTCVKSFFAQKLILKLLIFVFVSNSTTSFKSTFFLILEYSEIPIHAYTSKRDLVNFVYCFARLFHAPLVFPINAEISS